MNQPIADRSSRYNFDLFEVCTVRRSLVIGLEAGGWGQKRATRACTVRRPPSAFTRFWIGAISA